LPLILGPLGLKVLRASVSLPVSICIGTLGPAIACFVSHRMEAGNWRAVRVFPPLDRRSLWLLGGPLAILFCRFFLFAALITKGGPAAWHWHPSALAGILIPMFNYNLFGGPLFEEFGWRGYLQSHLQQMFPPWMPYSPQNSYSDCRHSDHRISNDWSG
jgi:membrane protease YdiL (CAAX protease family)